MVAAGAGRAPAQDLPEVKRLDLSEVVLTLKATGVEDLRRFRWLEAPGDTAFSHAEELLWIWVRRKTPHRDLRSRAAYACVSVHPRYARMLLAAHEYGCVYQACLVAALTQGRDLFVRKPSKDAASERKDLFGDKKCPISGF